MKDPLTNRDVQYFQAIARLKPGVTLVEAQQDLYAVGVAIQQKNGQTSGGRDVRVMLVRENLVAGVRDALLVIQAAVGLVLLIACANVSSLLIARATGRRRELAIRAALGAGRGRLIRQLLAESLVLGVCGGVAGLLLSSWLVVLLMRFLPHGLPRTDAISLGCYSASCRRCRRRAPTRCWSSRKRANAAARGRGGAPGWSSPRSRSRSCCSRARGCSGTVSSASSASTPDSSPST
jgi:hypothetical protein